MKRFRRVGLVLLCAPLLASPLFAVQDENPAASPRQTTYRNRGIAKPGSAPLSAGRVVAPAAVGEAPAALEVRQSAPSRLANAGCEICMQGANVSWTGNSGRFQLNQLADNRSSGTSGTLRLSVRLTSTVPVFGSQITSLQQSAYIVPGSLTAGSEFADIDSGTIQFYNSSIPAGSYYQIMLSEEQTGASWTYTDFIVFQQQVLCSGSSCQAVSVGSNATLLVPIVLDVHGAGSTHYTTSLTLTNLTGTSVPVVLDYRASLGAGSGLVALPMATGEQLIEPDVIAFLRQQGLNIPSDGSAQAGTLYVIPPSGTEPSTFVAGARTSTPGPSGGSFGVFYPALTLYQASYATAYVVGLQQNATQRSNLAVVNWGDQGDSITLSVNYIDGNGTPLGAPTSVTLAPGQWLQFNTPLQPLGATSGYAVIQETSGNSGFVAYGVLNDAVTSDGSYLPMNF
jgi:hypothetical protein